MAETAEMLKAPDAPHIGEVMSNFDHFVDKKVARKIKEGGTAAYPAWDFHGTVWWQDGQYHCQVMCYRKHVETLSADTCEELMRICSVKHGWD